MIPIVLAVLLTGLVSAFLTWWLIRPGAPFRILDHPNERSLHELPVPRTGGIAIVVALVCGWVFSLLFFPLAMVSFQVLVAAVMVTGVSMLDDRFGVPAALRLLVHLGAAMLLVFGGFVIRGEILPGIHDVSLQALLPAITVLLIIWLINLYNFMDGMDGFAAGMAVIGFATLALLGARQGDPLFMGMALLVCAAAAGFLWFNFPPARIFMGDTGSATLGFLVAGFAVWASRQDIAPVWLTLVIFSPFVVDATVTLVWRGLRREPVWRAHRSHYYQRVVQAGWSHRRTLLVEYGLMLISALSALLMVGLEMNLQWAILAGLLCLYVGAALAVRTLEHKTRC